MKKLYLLFLIAFSSNLFGQISQDHQSQQPLCGSHLDFEEMKKSDPERYQLFMDYELLLNTKLLNSKSSLRV